ncbi:PHP domain-containing protein [Candidatus Poribacteria bacterium]|nr:PHP domain-containing protein [Candidatus Poribacteria bacterium]
MVNYDLHTHSIYSDGKGSLHDNIHAAEAVGLDYIALTDHLWLYSNKWNSWLDRALEELEHEPPKGYKVKILKGAETQLLDKTGKISLDEKTASKLDIVLCDMGWESLGFPEDVSAISRDQVYEALVESFIGLCRNEMVDVMAHPFNLGRHSKMVLEPGDIPVDCVEKIAGAFVEYDTAFEVMNNIWWWHPQLHPKELTQQYIQTVRIFAQKGVKFSIGSDAHGIGGIGNLGWSKYVLKEAGVTSEQMIDPEFYLNRK